MKTLKLHDVGVLLLVLVVGFVMSAEVSAADKLRKQEIGHAPLKSISLPALWARSAETTFPPRFVLKFAPGQKTNVWILVFDQGIPVDETSRRALHDLLVASAKITSPVALTANQIRDVSPALGASNVGDNQYTNDARYPDRSAPVFQVSDAQIIQVNGKAVLKVNGSFMDQSGKPTTYHLGIFVETAGIGSGVVELSLESLDRHEFSAQQDTLDMVVKSIVWQK